MKVIFKIKEISKIIKFLLTQKNIYVTIHIADEKIMLNLGIFFLAWKGLLYEKRVWFRSW